MANPVYDDYQRRRFDAYFTANFAHKHLRPHTHVPLGDFAANRRRAREGNVALVTRNQHFKAVFENSLIFDFDAERRVYQLLLLMQEVARRNLDGDYAHQGPGNVLRTTDEYYVQTTKPGSRHDFSRGFLLYAVASINDRYVINHLEGVAD